MQNRPISRLSLASLALLTLGLSGCPQPTVAPSAQGPAQDPAAGVAAPREGADGVAETAPAALRRGARSSGTPRGGTPASGRGPGAGALAADEGADRPAHPPAPLPGQQQVTCTCQIGPHEHTSSGDPREPAEGARPDPSRDPEPEPAAEPEPLEGVQTSWEKGERVERFEARGRVRQRTGLGGGGATQVYAYDQQGRLSEIRSETGRRVELAYVEGSELVAIFDRSEGQSILRLLETRGDKPTRYETLEGGTWSFAWEGRRIASEAGPRGQRSYSYDALGRLRGWRDDSGREVFVSRSGAVTQVSSAEGDLVWTRSDAEGALRAAGQAGEEHTFRYAATGELLEVASPAGTFSYREGEAGRAHAGPFGTTTYVRDAFFPPQSPRLAGIETPAGAFRYRYDARGYRVQLSYPNGVVARYERDAFGQVRALRSSALHLQRTWDAKSQLREEVRDGRKRSYAYDGYGWLIRVEDESGLREYTRDVEGNRVLTRRGGANTREREVLSPEGHLVERRLERREGADWAPERVLARYEVDAAGRLSQIQRARPPEVDRFRYDGFGRLVEAQRAGRPAVRYTYDALGRLASRSLAGRTTRYVYDGLRLIAELSPGRTRVYAQGADLDEPLAYRDGAGPWVYLHADARGTVLAYSDARGHRIDAARYSPEGVLEEAPRAGRPLRFAGHVYDPVAGLVLMRSRAYDPALGRFLSADPAGIRDGGNPFLYAQGNPLSYTDPLGLWAEHPSIRAYYGALSPAAQLRLLGRVRDLALSPVPHEDLESFLKDALPGLEGDVPAPRKTGAASVGLAEGLARAATRAEARGLLDSELGQAAREELRGSPELWQIFAGLAEVQDDAERLNDAGLLRRLHAPRPQEEELASNRVRRVRIYGDLAGKYLGDSAWAEQAEGLSAFEGQLGEIERNRRLTLASPGFPNQDDLEFAALIREVDDLTRSPRVAARVSQRAAEVPPALWVKEHARAQEHALRYYSALPERRLYQARREALAISRRRRADELASPAKTRAALRAAGIRGRDALARLRALHEAEEAAGSASLARAEARFRAALIEPLGLAEANRRVAADTIHFYREERAVEFLAEARREGASQALEDPLPLKRRVRLPEPVDHETRFEALRELARAERAEAAVAREREEEQAAKARRYEAAKARARAGRNRRGVTVAEEPGAKPEPGAASGIVERLEEGGR